MDPPRFASLSIDPAATFSFFLNILVYAVIFLLVRDLTWRSWRRRSWAVVMPSDRHRRSRSMARISAEAPGIQFREHMRNRNHFAGLLEMVLPIAVAYGIALLKSDPPRTPYSADHTLPISARAQVLRCFRGGGAYAHRHRVFAVEDGIYGVSVRSLSHECTGARLEGSGNKEMAGHGGARFGVPGLVLLPSDRSTR